ncbi:hypothetical protein KK083_04215 [Fulvivirgaceae bacterium PWU4]|uniref:FecR protein domain-containing protein n=1 Tax=Chryseosolibacter histidini TaxID=2782349 RepID=A0AAP2GLQ1_9BACT|nr:hypothetical protein [Chryseosolibacter histidini]MBT1696068.1 hypothetical protein [Chryseosolibacter histidini]
MKLGSIALLMIAMLSPASFRDDILQKDVIPGMEVKTKWIRALEDSDVVLDGRVKATLKKGSKLIHPENFNGRDMDVTLIGQGSFEVPDGYQLGVIYDEVIVVTSGASFSLTKTPETIEVTVHDNQVVVSAGDRQVVVSRWQKVIYDTSKKRLSVIDVRIQMT